MRTTAAAFAVSIALSAGLLAGCGGGAGGNAISDDSYLYESRPYSPKTVELVDIRTDEVVWAIDVPVGWDLKMDFGEDSVNGDGVGIARMEWKLVPNQVRGKNQSGSFFGPPRQARRVDMSLRDAPEYPSGDTTEPEIAQQPEEET